MKKHDIGIQVTMHLGWKTYYKQISEIAHQRSDVNVHMIPVRLDLLGRLLTYDLPLFGKNQRLVDPIHAFERLSRQSMKQHTPKGVNLSVVHVASHLAANAVRKQGLAYTLGVDQTRQNSVLDFNNTRFSQRSLLDEKAIIAQSLHIQALNDWAHDSLGKDYGYPAQQLDLAYPSVVSKHFSVRDHSAKGQGLVKILFIGNDVYRKGGDRIKAWHEKHFSDSAELHLISNQAEKLGQPSKNQTFYPKISYQEIVNKVLPEMDLFVLPTEYDMSPYAAVEAAASGLPLIVSKMAGTSHICRHNVNGFCLDYADDEAFVQHIEQMVMDAGLRRELGQKSRKIVEQEFDATTNYNRLIDSLKTLAIQAN